jgi:cell wall-associated NlpC family hydrolase
MDSTKIAKAAERFIDKKWGLSCPDEDKFDCLNYLFMFYKELGVELPTEFEGHKKEDYARIWNDDYKKALSILSRWYRSLGRKLEPEMMRRGDLLLFDIEAMGEKGTATAIYLGNGNMLMVFGKQGCKVLPLGAIKRGLAEVRRII